MDRSGDRSGDLHQIDVAVTRIARVAYSRDARRRLEERSGIPLGPTAIGTLAAVFRHGPARLGAVAEHLELQQSRVSKEVQRLVAGGFVEQRVDPNDRRASLLAVTDKGADAFGRYLDAAEEVLTEVLSSWSDRDIRTLARLLTRLAADFSTV